MNPGTREIKRKVHFQDITDQIEKFEKDQIEWLVTEDLKGWNLWFILKKPLFYSFKHRHYRLKRSERKRPNRLIAFFSSIVTFAKLFYYLFTVREADAVIGTDVNRSVREDGILKDKFFGPLFNGGIINKALYFENNHSRDPGGIPFHINTVRFSLVSGLLWRYYSRNKYFREKAALFANNFNASVPDQNPALLLSQKQVLELITYFYAEFVMYRFFWKFLKPGRVFIADGIPRGVTAASQFYNIPVYEFQHGFVSDKKSDYIIRMEMKSCKNKMVLPGKIMVFGQYFKDLLLRSGFWNENEIRVLGSYPLDIARKSCSFRMPGAGEKIHIVWATQPTTFADASKLLNELAGHGSDGAVIHFRMHPLEPKAQKTWYSDLTERYPERFVLTPSHFNFFESLKGKHILVSFHSTVLLEAIALGYPVLSVATEKYQNGINDLVITDVSESVRPVKDAGEIIQIIERFRYERGFGAQWAMKCREQGNFFFDENYQSNLQHAFKN